MLCKSKKRAIHSAVMRAFVNGYKADRGCDICGERDPIVLQFHHRDPATKDSKISTIVNQRGSIKRLVEEIEKCQIVCANCHLRIHNSNA